MKDCHSHALYARYTGSAVSGFFRNSQDPTSHVGGTSRKAAGKWIATGLAVLLSCASSMAPGMAQAQGNTPAVLNVSLPTMGTTHAGSVDHNPQDLHLANQRINLGGGINSPYSDLYPIISPDENLLFFVRKGAPENVGSKTKADDEDIWYATRQGGSWSSAEHLPGILNTAYYDGVRAINSTSTHIYLQNIYRPDGTRGKGFSMSTKQADGSWSFPEPLEIEDYYNDTTIAMMTISNDEETLVLAVQRKDGLGKHDLFVSHRTAPLKFSKPELIGDLSTTAGDEISPFIAYDDRTIYFSTDSRGGFGQQDVFVAHRLDDSWKHWTEPQNMGEPVNTPSFDAYFMVSGKGDTAYLSSSHESARGFGKSDIWKVGLTPEQRPGFQLPNGKLNIPEKQLANAMLRLDNVLFDVGKSTIKDASKETLDKLVQFMKDYPHLHIEVQGHTDNDGAEPKNVALSQDRANSVRSYLISHAVAGDRVAAIGFGSSKPIAPNTTAEGKQLNRRVMVLVKDAGQPEASR